MKFIISILLTGLCSISFAMSKEEFLALDLQDKEEFLSTKATEVTDEKAIESFKQNNPQLLVKINQAAEYASDVWRDTVLEGPYATTGDIETEVTTIYTYNNEVFAVYAVVSAPAIFTDSCEYDEEADEWGDDCSEGSISETIAVDTDGNIIDMGFYPDFNN